MRYWYKNYSLLGMLLVAVLTATTANAAYVATVQEAQSKLSKLGHDPGALDGFMGPNTSQAILAYQIEKGLSQTGELDSETLSSLSIGVSTDLSNSVVDWQVVPTQTELDELKTPINNPANPYADYRRFAPSAGFDLPGKAILDAMNKSANQFGSRAPGHPNHTQRGLKLLAGCLKTGHHPDHWSDVTVHYYCQMSLPRKCYTNALAGKSTGGVKFSRPKAYAGCANGQLPDADGFRWVTSTQPNIFQFLMFAQTHAFNHEQEQAIINSFYGVTNPKNREECKNKRPLRTEDPKDGTHCLVDKKMSRKLVGRSR